MNTDWEKEFERWFDCNIVFRNETAMNSVKKFIKQTLAKEKKAVLEEAFQLLKKCTSSGDYVGASDDELKMIARFRKQIAHSQEDREGKDK